MKKTCLLAVIPGALAAGALVLILTLFLVKILWAWTIPDLFPGAVEQGLVAESISWFTAFKVAILVGVFGGVASGSRTERR